jgi:hypothetical protein
MSKALFLALILFLSAYLPTFSQSQALEKEAIMQRYKNKELTQLEYKDLVFAWRGIMDSIDYPIVPFDSVSKKVEYEYLHDLEGISRETIVNRVSEWTAVTFGSTDGLLTQQGNTSRLILNGSIEVLFPDLFMVWKNSWAGYVEKELQNSSICYFMLVFTIQEGRMKTRVVNISYQYTDPISEGSVDKALTSYFPISSHKKEEWRAVFTLIDETKKSLDIMTGLLVDYIKDYENDYNW